MEGAIVRNLATNIDRSKLITTEKHIKTFLIVWLMGEVLVENSLQQNESNKHFELFVGLQNIKQRVYKYDNVETCIRKLHKKSNKRVFLIVSHNISLNDADISTLYSLPQVDSIYQFGSEMPWKKLRSEVVNSDSHQPWEEEATPISILPSTEVTTSTEDQDITRQIFVMEQLLVELLLRLASGDEGKKDFANYCRETYQSNEPYLNEIDRFEHDDIENKAIWWYTGETFVYRILSKTFGTSNLNLIYKIRFFTYELHSELKELYRLQLPTLLKTTLNVYRGVSIPKTDLDCLRRSFGKLVITNSFLSTSTEKNVAAAFATCNGSTKDSVSVIFCMKINVQKNSSKPIASIKDHSQIQDEDEVLLSIGVVFRMVSSRQIAKNKWEIDLVRGAEEEQFEENFYNNLPIAETNALITMVAFLATISSGQNFVEYSGHLAGQLSPTHAIPNLTGTEHNMPASHDPTSAKISQPDPSNTNTSWWTNVTNFAHQYPAVIPIATVLTVCTVVLVVALPIELTKGNSTKTTPTATTCLNLFGNQATFPAGNTPRSVAVGDFNNDNRLDIVVASFGSTNMGVFLGYGDGTFASQVTYAAGSVPWSAAVGDFNNDNRLDIAVANSDSASVTVLLGYGNGAFASQTTYPAGSGPLRIAVGDFNNDHALDIVVANSGSSSIGVLLGDGTGTFASQTAFSTGSSPISVAVGDFNNDNRLDVAFTNNVSSTVGVLLNTC